MGKGRPGGNPDLVRLSKERSCGPTSRLGKMRAAVNPMKFDNIFTPAMLEYHGTTNSELKKKLLNVLTLFQAKELNTLDELYKIYNFLSSEAFMTAINRVSNRQELRKVDIERFRLLKDILVEFNKIKFGETYTIEKKITFEDIRRTIIDVNPSIPEQKDIIQEVVPQETKNDN